MGELLLRSGMFLLFSLACPAAAQADASPAAPAEDLPSAEMLEFLGDLDAVDDETWRLLEHHALRDLAQNQEVKDE